jgi:hypothetical protein
MFNFFVGLGVIFSIILITTAVVAAFFVVDYYLKRRDRE